MERFITAPVWVEGETRGSQLVNARMKRTLTIVRR